MIAPVIVVVVAGAVHRRGVAMAAGARVGTESLHLALGVVVHKPRVAGEVLWGRYRYGNADGVGFLSGRHIAGIYRAVLGCVSGCVWCWRDGVGVLRAEVIY